MTPRSLRFPGRRDSLWEPGRPGSTRPSHRRRPVPRHSCVRVWVGWAGAGGSVSQGAWSYPGARGRTRERVVVPGGARPYLRGALRYDHVELRTTACGGGTTTRGRWRTRTKRGTLPGAPGFTGRWRAVPRPAERNGEHAVMGCAAANSTGTDQRKAASRAASALSSAGQQRAGQQRAGQRRAVRRPAARGRGAAKSVERSRTRTGAVRSQAARDEHSGPPGLIRTSERRDEPRRGTARRGPTPSAETTASGALRRPRGSGHPARGSGDEDQ